MKETKEKKKKKLKKNDIDDAMFWLREQICKTYGISRAKATTLMCEWAERNW